MLAMLYVFMGIGSLIVDGGFGAALIQKQGTSREEESAVFYLGLGTGLVAGLALGACGPLIATFFGQPEIAPLAWVMGLNLFLGALGSVHSAQLSRGLDFRTLTKVGVAATAVSGPVAVAVAWGGGGVWALATQTLVGTATTIVLLWWLNPWRPTLAFHWRALKSLFRFGSFLLLSAILDQAYSGACSALIGRLYGASDLGFYTRADGTRQVPASVVTGVVSRVAFPAFALLAADPERLRRAFRRALHAIMLFNVPVMLGLLVVAEPLILTLFGEKWRPTISLLRVLCLAGLLWPLHVVNLNVLTAQGHSRDFFRVEVVKKVTGLSILLAVAPFGLLSMAWGQVAIAIVAFFVNAHFTGVYLRYGALTQVRGLLPYVAAGLAMAAGVWALDRSVGAWPIAMRLAVDVVGGAAVYVGLCAVLRLEAFAELLVTLRERALARA